jgi:hypothetical protein
MPKNKGYSRVFSSSVVTIYAPMIYTAPCIMFWIREYPLRGQVGGGGALEIEIFFIYLFFLALWNGIEPIGECHLGPKKLVRTVRYLTFLHPLPLSFLCGGKGCYRNRTVATFCIGSRTINLLADCLHLHVLFIIRSVNCSRRLKIFRFPIRAQYYTAIVSL